MENKAQQNRAILKKITIKVVCGELQKPTKETMLMRIWGQATGYRVAKSNYGDSVGFSGVFKAINHATGEIFQAGECFLPKVLETQLAGILGGGDTEGAQFAVDIGIAPANNAFGYEYRAFSVIPPKESPVLAALEEQMGYKQLAAPVEAGDAPADKPASGKKGK